MSITDERCPWPFPGPHYDWTTDDELSSIVGQLRQLAEHVENVHVGVDLRQIAADLQRAREVIPQHAQMPAEEPDRA